MTCPKCSSKETVKNGFMKGAQRYLCKECEYTYTTPHGKGKPKKIKRKALELYLEGLGFRAIGRTLDVSNVAVLKWVRLAAETLKEQLIQELPKQKREIQVMELDELWHYVLKKRVKLGFGSLSIEKLLL